MLRDTVPVCLQWHRKPWRWLRGAWTQGHVWATFLVVWHPLVQETPQVVLDERNQKVQALPPQRAQQALAKGTRLGAAPRGFEHPQHQVAQLLVELA